MKHTHFNTINSRILFLYFLLTFHYQNNLVRCQSYFSFSSPAPDFVYEQQQSSVIAQKIVEASKPIRNSYRKLPPKARFVTGAVVGLTTTRFTINTAIRVLKWGGATFLITEVIHASGILHDVDFLSEENQATMKRIRNHVFLEVDKIRMTIREKFMNLNVMRSYIDNVVQKDISISTGFATGAAIALIF